MFRFITRIKRKGMHSQSKPTSEKL